MKKTIYFLSAIICAIALNVFVSCDDDIEDPGFFIDLDFTADKTEVNVDENVTFTLKAFAVDEKGSKVCAYIDGVEWCKVTTPGKYEVLGVKECYGSTEVEKELSFDEPGEYQIFTITRGHFGQYIFAGCSDTLDIKVGTNDNN